MLASEGAPDRGEVKGVGEPGLHRVYGLGFRL